ncbi:MAG: hypothetical protein HFG41_10345 [Coprococcus sp.]|nr:hypothetical protein [Coprococcus sp.]
MRQYQICELKKNETVKIVCNMCKKEIDVVDGIPQEDVLSVEKRWGYFSGKDNEVHRFDLCEECYDKLIRSFGIPAEKE